MQVSIVIPVFNVAPDLLEACFRSVAMQTLRTHELEVVVVDDGSTELPTRDLVDEWTRNKHWILERHEINRGLNHSRETGVRSCNGEYILFLDGDDMLTRDGAELLLNRAIAAGAQLVTAPMYRWSASSKTYGNLPITGKGFDGDLRQRLQQLFDGQRSFTMCGRLFHRSLLDDGIFDMPEGVFHEDLITMPRILASASKVSHLNNPIYYYTVNPGSITQSYTLAHIQSLVFAMRSWVDIAGRMSPTVELTTSIDRLTNTAVRRMLHSSMTVDEQCQGIHELHSFLAEQAFEPPDSIHAGTALVHQHGAETRPDLARHLGDARRDPDLEPVDRPEMVFPKGLGPSSMALRLKDKLVFIAQVDYQVRNAARLAAEMRRRGVPCVILDNSDVVAGGKRRFATSDKTMFHRLEHIKVDKLPYPPDWLSTARMVVTFNDFGSDAREALEYRTRLGLPTACMVEGINDFLRVDFDSPRARPYRRCDFVLLAGEHDQQYFEDRATHVIGMPIIEELAASGEPQFPAEPLVVLNVNFTYGSLEERRDLFVSSAAAAFEAAGVDWTITQHPMDKGDLGAFTVSASTQYELIDGCSVFVSRFATGIIEALACGKPAIYFNPHHEKVQKFTDPLGAFPVCTTAAELVLALKETLSDIDAGVDFRERAAEFLRVHAALGHERSETCGTRFASAVTSITRSEPVIQRSQNAANALISLLDLNTPGNGILGEFDRSLSAQMNEEELISRVLDRETGLLFDVGANLGNSLDVYLGLGWDVHAFEPDPNNRARLEQLWPGSRQLTIIEDAVSDRDGDVVPFFASDESTGISGLSAFTDGHRQIAEVRTTTLATYMESAGIEHVDFLKIDVEGFDKFAFDGFPWDRDRPLAVLTEYEDSKTVPLGYDAHALAQAMIERGYTVYLSEWYPIVRYGIAHDWRRLKRYSDTDDLSTGWGNFIGFLEDPGIDRLAEAARLTVRFGARATGVPATGAVTPADRDSVGVPAPWYARPADRLRRVAPRKYAMLRQWRRALSSRGSQSRRWVIQQFANGLRDGMPLAFRSMQPFAWVARWCIGHPVFVLSWFGIAAATGSVGLISGEWWPFGLISVVSACVLALSLILVAITEARRKAERRRAELLRREARRATASQFKKVGDRIVDELNSVREDQLSGIHRVQADLVSVRAELASLKLEQDQYRAELPAQLIRAMSSEVDRRLDSEADRLQRRLAQVEARVAERIAAGELGVLEPGVVKAEESPG